MCWRPQPPSVVLFVSDTRLALLGDASSPDGASSPGFPYSGSSLNSGGVDDRDIRLALTPDQAVSATFAQQMLGNEVQYSPIE